MKALLLSFIGAFALLFSACSKEEPATPKEEERFSVTLNVSTLSHDIVPMASLNPTNTKLSANSTGKKLSDVVDYLSYAVYGEDGKRLAYDVIHKSGTDFGTIKGLFSKGKYKVLVFGQWEMFYDPFMFYHEDSRIYSYGLSDDVFYAQFDMEVLDSNVEKEVVLKRKVGKVAIELTDKVPTSILFIRYSLEGASEFFVPQTNRGENTAVISKQLYFDTDGTPLIWERDPLSFYFFLDNDQETKVNVKLEAIDRDYNVVAEKIISDVPVGINRITKLRGSLFDNVGAKIQVSDIDFNPQLN